jgi:ribosomal protein L44E
MQCPRCKGLEVATDHTPRPVIHTTKEEEKTYIRHECATCDYEWLTKSYQSEGEHLLK